MTVEQYIEKHGTRKTAAKMVNKKILRIIPFSLDDLADTPIVMNWIDEIQETLEAGDIKGAWKMAKEAATEILEDEGMYLDCE